MSKAIFKGILAVAVLAVAFLSQARAADDTKSQTYVVVVGIDQYKDTQILPRKHAEADAKMLSDVFTSPDYLGVDANHIRLLLGKDDPKRKSQPATRENILLALNWVVENSTKDDPPGLPCGASLAERDLWKDVFRSVLGLLQFLLVEADLARGEYAAAEAMRAVGREAVFAPGYSDLDSGFHVFSLSSCR